MKNKIISLLKEGKSLSEISQEVFNTKSTAPINSFMAKNGIDASLYNERYKYMNREWLKEKINEHKTISEISKKYSIPRTSLTRYAIKYELYDTKYTRNAKNNIDENYFDMINTSNKAYWLGLFMADGCMTYPKYEFSIKLQEKDSSILEELAENISFPKDKISHQYGVRNGKKNYYCRLRTYNKKFCSSLFKNGIVNNKTGKEYIPSTVPNKFMKDFIRGFWDGDGSIQKNRIYVASTSFTIIKQISKWLCMHNIHYYIDVEEKNVNMFSIRIAKKSWKDFKNVVYYDGCLGLKRKKEMITNIIQSLEG